MTNYTVKAKVPMEIGLDNVESEEEAKQIVKNWFHAQLSTGDDNYPCTPDVREDIEFKSIEEGW